jgi:hypothetical protein
MQTTENLLIFRTSGYGISGFHQHPIRNEKGVE